MDYYNKKIDTLVKKAKIFDSIFGSSSEDDSSEDTSASAVRSTPLMTGDVNVQRITFDGNTKFKDITDPSEKPAGVLLEQEFKKTFKWLKNISSDKKNLKLNFDSKSIIGNFQDFFGGMINKVLPNIGPTSLMTGLLAIPREAQSSGSAYQKHFNKNIIPHLFDFLKQSANYSSIVKNEFLNDITSSQISGTRQVLGEQTSTIMTIRDGKLLLPEPDVVAKANSLKTSKNSDIASKITKIKSELISSISDMPEKDINEYSDDSRGREGFGTRILYFHIKLTEPDSFLFQIFSDLSSISQSISNKMTVDDILNLYKLTEYARLAYSEISTIISRVIFKGSDSISSDISTSLSENKVKDNFKIDSIRIPLGRNNKIQERSQGGYFFNKSSNSDGTIILKISNDFYESVNKIGGNKGEFLLETLITMGLITVETRHSKIRDLSKLREAMSTTAPDANKETVLTFSNRILNRIDGFNHSDDMELFISFENRDRVKISVEGGGGRQAIIFAKNKRRKTINKYGEAVTAPLYSYKDENGKEIDFTVYDLIKNRGKIKDSSGKSIRISRKKSKIKPKSLSSIVNSWKPKGK